MSALDVTAERQAIWSATADKLKKTLDTARWTCFGLAILGAVLGIVFRAVGSKRRIGLRLRSPNCGAL